MTEPQNPYQHQEEFDDLEALLAEPPKWPKVVGILSIVWGALSLTCAGLGTASMVFMPKFMEGMAKQQNVPAPPFPQMTPTLWALNGLGVALAVLLVVAGIATLARKPAGRTLHLVYAVAGIVVVLASTYFNIQMQADQHEAMAEYAQKYPDSPFAQQADSKAAAIGQIAGPIFGLIIGLAWPLFCLIWFLISERGRSTMKGTALEAAA